MGNFYIVFLYNAAFAGLTTLCLVKTFTAAVRAELIRAFGEREWGRGWWGGRTVEPSGTVVIPKQGSWHTLCLVCNIPHPSIRIPED